MVACNLSLHVAQHLQGVIEIEALRIIRVCTSIRYQQRVLQHDVEFKTPSFPMNRDFGPQVRADGTMQFHDDGGMICVSSYGNAER